MIDASQVMQAPQQGRDRLPAPTMVRLHNPTIGVQVHVAVHKADRLLAEGYRHGALPKPADEKPTAKVDKATAAKATPAAAGRS